MRTLTPEKIQRQFSLSKRERSILRLACHGLKDWQIADKLCLAPRTVREYWERMFTRYAVKSRLHLFYLWNKAGRP